MLLEEMKNYPNAYMLFYEKVNKDYFIDYDYIDVIVNNKNLISNNSSIL